jgi:hypothetical protein
MNGWMDEWMGGWVNEWMDGWITKDNQESTIYQSEVCLGQRTFFADWAEEQRTWDLVAAAAAAVVVVVPTLVTLAN